MEVQKFLYPPAGKATNMAANSLRSARQEAHGPLPIIGALLKNGEAATALQKYFAILPRSIASDATSVHTGNAALDAVLNWAEFTCNGHGIPLSVQVDIPHAALAVNALALFSMLSNLLASAIAFSKGLCGSMVCVQVKAAKGRLSIRIHSRVCADALAKGGDAQAPAAKARLWACNLATGIVRRFVRQNGGNVRFIHARGMLCADVLLYPKAALGAEAPSDGEASADGDMPGIYVKRYDSDGEAQEKHFFNVAVCEGNPQSRNILSNDIRKSFTQCQCNADVQGFPNLGELRRALSSTVFDVIFMDIVLPDGSGIDFVRGLRTQLPEVPKVVFVSSRTDLVFEAFAAHPFGFIRKSNFRQELGGVVSDLAALPCDQSRDILCVESNGELYSLHIPEIRYIECINKVQIIHLTTRTYSVRKTLAEFEELLTPYGFIKSHKSYLVNYRYIAKVSNFDIELDDETSIPISKHRLHDVKIAFRRLLQS